MEFDDRIGNRKLLTDLSELRIKNEMAKQLKEYHLQNKYLDRSITDIYIKTRFEN
jgi:hypothetical protein